MSKISEIIKARESGNNLHFIKKADMELGKIYPVKSAIRNNGTFGPEIRITLTDVDDEGKNYAVSNSAMRPDGKPTAFATLYDDFVEGDVAFEELGVFVEEVELYGKLCRQMHFAELA